MSKAAQRRKGRAPQQGPIRGPRRPPTFYERNRSLVWLGAMVVVAMGVFALTRPGGESSATGAFTGGDFHSMVVDPQNPNRIFVGGHEAVSVSQDSGKSWRQVSSLQNRDAMGWGFEPEAIYLSGHPGLTISNDGGKTFNEHNEGLPSTDVHSFGSGKGVLYGASPQSGFFSSTDAGNSWRVVNPGKGRSFFGRILVDPNNVMHLVVADVAAGVAESMDGGRTFDDLGGVTAPSWVSWDPNKTLVMVASGQQGAARSEDGGKTWRSLKAPSPTALVEMDPTDPQRLYAGTHDGSNVSVLVSRDGGSTWRKP
jgi:photosystem II stability/assembly factor-like uncharacterized protein